MIGTASPRAPAGRRRPAASVAAGRPRPRGPPPGPPPSRPRNRRPSRPRHRLRRPNPPRSRRRHRRPSHPGPRTHPRGAVRSGEWHPGLRGWHPMAMVRTPDRRPRLVALLLVATLLTGLAATVSAAPALPACKIGGRPHEVPRLCVLASVAARPDLPAAEHVRARRHAIDVLCRAQRRLLGPQARDRRPQGDGECGPRGRRPRSSSSRRTAAIRRRRRRSTTG